MAMRLNTIRMPPETWDKLSEISDQTGISVSDHIRHAVEMYLQNLSANIEYTIVREERVRYEFRPADPPADKGGVSEE